MQQLWRLLLGRTARNTTITGGANIVYGLLILLFTIIASRALGPQQYGLLSLALAVFAISADILNLGTSSALIRFVSMHIGRQVPSQALLVTKTIFVFRLVEMAVLLLTSGAFGYVIATAIYGQGELISLFTLAIASASGILLMDFLNVLLQAYEQFIKSAVLSILTALSKIIILTILIHTGRLTLFSAALAFVITPFLVSFIGWGIINKNFLRSSFSSKVFHDIFHFSKWMAIWGITASLTGRMALLLLGKLSTPYETGIYAVAANVATGFTLLGSALGTVLTPKISRIQHDPDALKRLYSQMTRLLPIIWLGMVTIASTSRWFIPLLFGTAYMESIPVFYLLTLASAFFITATPSSVSLLALGHAKFIGLLSLFQLGIIFLVGSVTIPQNGSYAAAISVIISNAVALAASYLYAKSKIYSPYAPKVA